MAYGQKHHYAFSGSQAVSVFMKLLQTTDRLYAQSVAEQSVNTYRLFWPCSSQLRKTRSSRDDLTVYSSESFNVVDDECTLYRLLKDMLLSGDISRKFLSDVVEPMLREPDTGVPVKESCRFRKVRRDDGVFSKRTLDTWMGSHWGVTDEGEMKQLRQVLVDRGVIRKLRLISCYQFCQP
jgi:hypothetical protein